MNDINNWKWWSVIPVVNWLGLLVAGQNARYPAWIRWAILYAALNSTTLVFGLLTQEWSWFWLVWSAAAVHTLQVQGEYRNRMALIDNPRLRLNSERELHLARELGTRIDLNRCDVDDLLRLPGLSINQARRIVEVRRSQGQYLSPEELSTRAELSWDQVRRIEPMLMFCYYEDEPARLPAQVAVNHATVAELEMIEGMTRTLAEQIVYLRTERGSFRDLKDLRERLALPATETARFVNRLLF